MRENVSRPFPSKRIVAKLDNPTIRFGRFPNLMPGLIHPSRFIPVVVGALAMAGAMKASADPLAELAAFSSFKEVNLEKLAAGTVQSVRGPAMSFPRGLAVESVYVLRKPLQKAAELHVEWNPNKHPELKVFLHTDLSARPTAAEFQKLGAAPANSSVKSFAAATQKLGSGSSDLQLSNADAKAFASQSPAAPAGGALPPKVAAFWSGILVQRAQAFLSGGAARLPPYETAGETIRPGDEIARLLKDAAKVRGQFSALIDANPLTGSKAAPGQAGYWEMFDVEGTAAVNLGALLTRSGRDGWQALDGQYYSSGGYYVLLTFYQLWPVKIAGQDCTLVWRGDLISAAALATLHGVERMGSSTAMMRETKKSIESLLKDAAKAP